MSEQNKSERECANEHVEAATGTVEQLQPEVPSSAGGMGEAADEWTKPIGYGPLPEWGSPCILNDAWVKNLIRVGPGPIKWLGDKSECPKDGILSPEWVVYIKPYRDSESTSSGTETT